MISRLLRDAPKKEGRIPPAPIPGGREEVKSRSPLREPGRRTHIALALVFFASLILSLVSLSHAAFWDDEAQVGIIAKNYLATGHLTGWDGRNLYAYRNGTLLDANLRYINPPLDCLVAAASFRVFHASTWAGRLPFVLAGWAGLWVFLWVLRRDFRERPHLHGYALGTLALSTLFLLNIRTCRYYALSLLFSLLIFYFYRRALAGKRWGDFLWLAAAAAFAFYSSFLLGGAFLLALGGIHFLFHRREFTRQDWTKAATAALVFALLTLPYAVSHQIWVRHDSPVTEPWLARRLTLLWWNVRDLGLINSFPWLAGIGLAFVFLRCRPAAGDTCAVREWDSVREWAALAFGYVFFLALFSPQPTRGTGIADVRYLLPAAPFLAGLIGFLLQQVHRRRPLVAVTLFLVLISSNLFSLTPANTEFRWLLPAYIAEVSRPYPTANEAAADFLLQNARQDDRVLAAPDYLDYPIQFYAGDKIRLCSQLDDRTLLPLARLRGLNAPLFMEENFPDWILCFGAQGDTRDMLAYFGRRHQEAGKPVRNSYRLVQVLDVYSGETQRPELPWHSFGPRRDFDPRSQAVYIFQRRR